MNEMKEDLNRSIVFKTIVILLLACLVAVAGYFAYDKYQQNKYELIPIDEIAPDTISVDEAVEMFKGDVIYEINYDKYLKLSPIIIRAIYNRIGTDVGVNDIIKEYESNKPYYISLQIQEQLPKVDVSGPDENNIKNIRVIPEIDSVVPHQNKMSISPSLIKKDTL